MSLHGARPRREAHFRHAPSRLLYYKRMANERTRSGSLTSELFAGLRSPAPDKAWKQFLEIYSPTIMLVAGQYEHHRDRLNDCYLFICEKLCDHGFRRILSYQPEGSASFRSWLNVVIANLCIDWRRHLRGRARPFKSIRALPVFDQMVFKYRIQQRMSPHACLAAMQPQFPDLTEPQLASAVSHINAMLTSRQHYLLSTQQTETVSLDQTGPEAGPDEPAEPGPGPEKSTHFAQKQERLEQALGELSPSQRLLLRLRYEQGLSLKEVARLMRLGDPFRARRQIQCALDELEQQLKD